MKEQNNLDLILSKYISVWIWSILFGATATMTYRMINILPNARDWGVLSAGFGAILIYGLIFLFMSWNYLYKYLDKYIIPRFFPIVEDDLSQEVDLGKKTENKLNINSHSVYLKRSYKSLILAALTMVIIEIMKLIISSYKF